MSNSVPLLKNVPLLLKIMFLIATHRLELGYVLWLNMGWVEVNLS